jgi:hypothetical protein
MRIYMRKLRQLVHEAVALNDDRRALEDAIANFASAWWGATRADLGQSQKAAAYEIAYDFMDGEYETDGWNEVAARLSLTKDDVADMVVSMLLKNFKKKVNQRGPSWR